MSAFNFINNSSPSPSLLDDIYDKQEFHSFVNQSSWHSSSPRSFLKTVEKSSTSSQQSSSPPLKNSAFPFIKQSSPSSPTTSNSMTFSNSTTPILSNSVFTKASPQMKLSSMTAHWSRLESDRSHHIQTLKRLYEKRTKVYAQITQLTDSIYFANQQKETAISNEDYEVAEQLHINQTKMSASLEDLHNVIEQIHVKIQQAYENLHSIIKKETECADSMIEQYEIVKEERQHHLIKFGTDSERMHEQKMQALQNRREKVETDKSEVAFDFGMWEQSDGDLRERMDEAIQEESEEKTKLKAKANTLQTEIDHLLEKIKQLTNEKEQVLQDLDHVESVMDEKLRPFKEEKQEHEKEYETIQQKKEEIDQKTMQLDEEEMELHKQIELHQEEKARGWEEIDAYSKKMENAAKRKDEGYKELETIEKISNIIQKRDQEITKQQAKMIRSRAALHQQSEETKTVQQEMILEKQKQVEQSEFISQMENKLASLKRYKTLAVESGQFQNASRLNEQIKTIENDLLNTKQVKSDSTTIASAWEDAKSKLEKMKSDHEDLEHQLVAEKKAILGKAKEEIQQIYDDSNLTSDLLKSTLDYELNILDQ